jgi:hypothetical protein
MLMNFRPRSWKQRTLGSELDPDLTKEHGISPYGIAAIYAGLGENDKAFEWLKRDLKERGSGMVFINVDQRLDNIRSDPRFAEVVREVVGSQTVSAGPLR